ncbi:halocyanin domain-containing protein [Halocatena halophila]|uniref:halocyanin domain-containing protein n=1 Tax=Halocatena halophila TaxID=2814576 RepID=UPI002ED04073
MQRRAVLRWTVGLTGVGLTGCLGSVSDGGESYGDFFADVDNYDGEIDRTNTDRPVVRVGTKANGGYFGFDPPAIVVTPETTVVWEWTGKGGRHNVVARSEAFSSKFATETGFTYERSISATGVYPYYCKPHRSVGMKGGVRVETA